MIYCFSWTILLSLAALANVHAQDYSITTAGNVLTITDLSGNGDILDVTEDGAGTIKFNVTNATRTYDFNGVTFSNLPYTHLLVGITSIVVNTQGGSDEIKMGAFANTFLPSLTLNGGTGDDAVNFNGDITFALNANLDVDLQNDDPTPGTDNVTLAASTNLVFSGTGAATVKVSKNVLVNAGGSIETVNGNLTLEANQQAIGTTGGFEGVALDGCLLTTRGTGTLTVKGKGGTINSSKIGVYLYNGGKIEGGSSNVNVTGTGVGAATNNNHGVFVEGANTRISSTGGNVSVIGIAGGFGAGAANNRGVVLTGSAQISAGGSGTVTVGGTGGTNAQGINNDGVLIAGNGSKIFSNGGDVSVTGVGGGTGGASRSNYGISLNAGGQISSGGSGTLTVNGTGGAGSAATSSNYGVSVAEVNTMIAAGGNLILTGTGGTAGTHNYGVNVADLGKITSNSSGTVGVTGNGGSGQNSYGVFVAYSGALISSGGGDVTVQGTGGSSGSSQYGVHVIDGGSISAGSMGNVSVTGTAGATSGFTKYGVYLSGNGASITSGGGNVTVTGIEGGSGAGTGFGFVNGDNGAITTATNGGNITVIANSMLINGPISTNAAGQTTLHQITNNIAFGLGDFTDTKGGPLKLSDTELDWVSTGTLVIGNANSGDIFVADAITRPANTAMQLITAGDITFNQGINTGGGNLLLDCGNTPKSIKPTFNGTDATVGTLSFGSDLALFLNGTTPGDGSGSTYSQLVVVGSVNLTGVDLVLSGTYVPVAGQSFIIVDNDLSDAITGTFNGLAEGVTIANFLGSTYKAIITYVGGSNNNDVVLTVLPADYSITTTGGNLVITDLAGNSDQLDVTQNGAGIQFATLPARTYSLDGAAPVAFPVTIPNVANFNNITINTATGDDVNNIGAFTAALKNLTINGGTGNDAVNFNGDITFAPNANLDVDLQNDDPTPGTDNVTVAANANLLLSGTGAATVKVSKNVLISAGGSIETANGDLTVEANQQATPTSGGFVGVDVDGGSIQTTGTGTLTVKGRGGNSGSDQYGVQARNGGKIEGGSGLVTVQGTGGAASGDFNYGVMVLDTDSRITSSGGDVSVTGQGGGSGASVGNFAVYVVSEGQITADGSGKVTVQGTGGATTGNGNYGVIVSGTNTHITSSGGDVSVTGQGGGTGASASNIGVLVAFAGQITAGGSGRVTVQGTGGAASGDFNSGVYVFFGTDSRITSSGGDVSVTGLGGGTGASAIGVYVLSAGQITAGGSGKVTVQGTGGATSGNSNYGVIVSDTDSRITSSGGDVSVTGLGGGTGASASNYGVYVISEGQITAGGSGKVTVLGNGGTAPTGDINYGVLVSDTDSKITSSGGDVSVTGTGGGSGTSDRNRGIVVQNAGQITAGGSGTVTVVGNGGSAPTGNLNYGVFVNGTDSKITSFSGNVSVTGTGGGSDMSSDNYGISIESAGQITSGGSGTVTVVGNGGTAPTGGFNYGVYVTGTDSRITSSGGNVSVTGTGGGTGASGDNYGIYVHLAGQITAGMNGTVTVLGNGGIAPTGNSNIGVLVNGTDSKINSSGGNVSVTGTGGGSGASGSNHGIYVQFAGQITAGGSGTVTVVGNGGTSSTGISNHGVYVYNTDAKITSSGGNVSVTGTGGGSGTNGDNYGIYVLSAGQITAGGSGTVTVVGNGGTASTGNANFGVYIYGTNSKITTSGGNVSVTGTGGGTGASADNEGILILAGQIEAGGNGTVTVAGNGGTTSTGIANHGIYILDAGAMISSNGGNVRVTGTGGGMDASAQNVGVYLDNSQIKAGGNGTVTVEGYGGNPSTGGSNLGILSLVNGQITSSGGNVSVTGIEGSGPNSTGYVSSFGGQITTVPNGGNIALIANSMSIGGGVSTPAGNSVTLRPYSNGVQVDLGSTSNPIGGPLGLSDEELDLVTTGTLNIGDANTGDITVSAAITRPASTVINLTSGDEVNLDASALNSAGGNVNIDAANGTNPRATGTDVNTGASSTLDFAAGDKLNIAINGTSVDAQYSQLNIVGKVDITGVDLVLSGSYTPGCQETITLINNDDLDAVTGHFTGLLEGATVASLSSPGLEARISYVGGDGNDVVIKIFDVQPPTITCPNNRTVNTDAGQCSSVQTYTVTVSDNCAYTLTRTNGFASGSAFPLDFNVVNWQVTDAGGNSTICSFSITVVDAQTPTITCPSSSTVAATTGQCAAVVNYSVSGSDNCSGWSLSRTSGLQSGALFPVGTTTVTWKNTDTGGNSTTCSFTVTVTESQLPNISCPANITTNAAAGLCSAIVNYATPIVSDNCSVASAMHVSGGTSGSSFNKGVNTVEWKATDAANNTKTCSFTITVNDTQAPTITCPANITANTGANACAATVNFNNATATDNCTPAPTVAQTGGQASGSSFPKGLHTLTFRATDGVGLTKACTFRITVVDNILPTINCPSNIVKNTDNNLCTAVTTYSVTGADNCTSVSVSRMNGMASGSAFPKGSSTVIWRATDLAGNSTLCSFTVTVNDAQLPGIINCPTSINTTTAPGQCNRVVNYTTPTYTDNCTGGSISLFSGLASGSVFPTGTSTVTWRAFDNSANSADCAFTITVTDNQQPMVTCPPSATVSGSGSPCGFPASQLNTATASDNCAVTSLTNDAPATLPAGPTTITWTAKDAANNQKTCAYVVTVNCGASAGARDEVGSMKDKERYEVGGMKDEARTSLHSLIPHPLSLITHHLSLSPNPASDIVVVTLSNQQINSKSTQHLSASNQQLLIHDAMGRQIWVRKLEAGVEQVKIDLASGVFEDGVYQLSWLTESKVITKTLVVARR